MDAQEIAELLPFCTPEQQAELIELLSLPQALWQPNPGAQTRALQSDADILGYGGRAGGGKSDLLCGLALTEHTRSLIIRREKAQTRRFSQRLTELRGSSQGYNSQLGQYALGEDKLVEFGGLDNPDDHERWRGIDHDLKAIDEATDVREAQARFIMGWARSAKQGQRVRIVLTFNPPATPEGRWIIKFFAPWLDDKHTNPAKPGELRWFTTIDGNPDYEVPDGRPFVVRPDGTWDYDFDPNIEAVEDIRQPLSRTFIPAKLTDNPYLMKDKQYVAQLQATPEPLRSQLLHGDFKAGISDDEWQVIPTAWIDEAMERWAPRRQRKGPMDSIGADVAAGGGDEFVISRRHDLWFDELVVKPGSDFDQTGIKGAGEVVMHRRDQAPVHVDVVGWGSAVHGQLHAQGIQSVPINGASKSIERTKNGDLKFTNLRAEGVWRLREALDPSNDDKVSLPYDLKLRSDLAAYRWVNTPSGILIESKDEMKERLGRSPDRGDAVWMALRATIKTQTLIELYEEVNRGSGGYDRNAEMAKDLGIDQ